MQILHISSPEHLLCSPKSFLAKQTGSTDLWQDGNAVSSPRRQELNYLPSPLGKTKNTGLLGSQSHIHRGSCHLGLQLTPCPFFISSLSSLMVFV